VIAHLAFWNTMTIRLVERQLRSRRLIWPGIVMACLAAAGCSGGQNVTAENLAAARQRWASAGIRDYDLEYTTSPANGHFLVTVRDGQVKKVEGIQPGGSRTELHPGAPRYYSVDGLFVTIADELLKLDDPRPFDQPRGTTILMKFKPNPKLGYPEWWHRDVVGTSLNARFDVVSVTPTAAGTKPEKE
jgi:hypothetical protein